MKKFIKMLLILLSIVSFLIGLLHGILDNQFWSACFMIVGILCGMMYVIGSLSDRLKILEKKVEEAKNHETTSAST